MKPPVNKVTRAHIKAMRSSTERWLQVMMGRLLDARSAYDKHLMSPEEWARVCEIGALMLAIEREVKDW